MKTDEELRAENQKEWSFDSEDRYHLTGRGDVYIVTCPISCYTFDWLMNREITVNGQKVKVIGVESQAKARPLLKGAKIGLLIHSMNYAT